MITRHFRMRSITTIQIIVTYEENTDFKSDKYSIELKINDGFIRNRKFMIDPIVPLEKYLASFETAWEEYKENENGN